MIATLLGASIGVPYVMSHKPAGPAAPGASATHAPSASGNGWSWPWAAPAATLTGVSAATPTMPVLPGQQPLSPTPQLESVRMHPVETVLRFDLTRDWVYRNWDRKSTGPTDVGLLAVRVALVSGRDIGSLAGSLTYFFNDQGAIEHISFRGRTGDSTRLVNFLTKTYHFARVASPTGEQVYQVGSGDKVQSELRTHPESVLTSASPHSSIAVELELARPGSQRYLPPRVPALSIPQVATTAPPPTTAAAEATTANAASSDPTGITSGVKSTFDKARYATPQEENQMHWARWPN
jgi:hypothetical protein